MKNCENWEETIHYTWKVIRKLYTEKKIINKYFESMTNRTSLRKWGKRGGDGCGVQTPGAVQYMCTWGVKRNAGCLQGLYHRNKWHEEWNQAVANGEYHAKQYVFLWSRQYKWHPVLYFGNIILTGIWRMEYSGENIRNKIVWYSNENAML